MLARFRPRRPSHGTVVAYLALFVALGGTTYAAATIGSNSIKNNAVLSRHIKDGEVKNPDLGANSVGGGKVIDNSLTGADIDQASLDLATEPWHDVGSDPGDAVPFRATSRCHWQNFEAGTFNAAAFTRDRSGFVHLKGLVNAVSKGVADQACGASGGVVDYYIFILPPGYRPAQQEVHATLSNHVLGRVNVFGSGAISFEFPTTWSDAHQWIVLDGISFRCAPSGADGCP
jgi:hypothetical protein